MPENASFQGLFAEVSFDTSYGNQLSYFQNGYSSKTLWWFHDSHNQVKYRWKINLFPELFINKMFGDTFVWFVSDRSLTINYSEKEKTQEEDQTYAMKFVDKTVQKATNKLVLTHSFSKPTLARHKEGKWWESVRGQINQ